MEDEQGFCVARLGWEARDAQADPAGCSRAGSELPRGCSGSEVLLPPGRTVTPRACHPQGTGRSCGGRATSPGARRSTSTTVSKGGAASSWPRRRRLVCKSPAVGTRWHGVGCCARLPRENGLRGARAPWQLLGPPRASPVPRGRCERGYTGARCERVDLFYLRGDQGQIVIISLIVAIVALIILVVGICLCSQYVGERGGKGKGRGSKSCLAPLAPGRLNWGCPRPMGHAPAGVGRCLGHSFGAGKRA